MLSVLSTVIVPGLVEEFACRGIILSRLRRHGDGFAILVSSIIFGVMHGNFDQMPFAFVVGLGLGFIVVKTNSLWIAMAVHATNNFVSVAFSYFFNEISSSVQNLIYVIYLMTALLLGVISLIIMRNKEDLFKLKKNDDESNYKQKFKWFFTSAPIIIFIVICILESLIYF